MKLIINIIFSIIILGSAAFSLYKIFAYKAESGINEKEGRLSGVSIALAAFAFRIIIYVISALFAADIDGGLSADSFLERWVRWDASNYIRIAEGWYTGYTENGDYLTLVFFPLYSIIARALNFIIPDIRAALMITSSAAYAVGCIYMYELVCIDYGRKTALNSVISISLFPFAFFFGAIMTEGVFFMTAAMTFYYIRKHNWLAAGICGAFCAFSRMIGVFMVVPAFVEWADCYKPFTARRKEFWGLLIRVLPVLFAFVGIAAYLFINYSVTGDAFKFMEYQKEYWNHTNCYFGNTISDIFEYALNPDTREMLRISIWIPEMVIFTVSAIALIYCSYYMRSMYSLYLAGYIIINCSVTWLISGARYMSAAIPMFIVFGHIARKNRIAAAAMHGISFALMLWYLYRYLANMQIM